MLKLYIFSYSNDLNLEKILVDPQFVWVIVLSQVFIVLVMLLLVCLSCTGEWQ